MNNDENEAKINLSKFLKKITDPSFNPHTDIDWKEARETKGVRIIESAVDLGRKRLTTRSFEYGPIKFAYQFSEDIDENGNTIENDVQLGLTTDEAQKIVEEFVNRIKIIINENDEIDMIPKVQTKMQDLENRLNKAIEEEDYKEAAKIRDEITKISEM